MPFEGRLLSFIIARAHEEYVLEVRLRTANFLNILCQLAVVQSIHSSEDFRGETFAAVRFNV